MCLYLFKISEKFKSLKLCSGSSVLYCLSVCLEFVVGQLPSRVWFFETPWTAGHQVSLSLTISWSFPKFMFIVLVMPSSHLILWCPSLSALNLSQHQGLLQWSEKAIAPHSSTLAWGVPWTEQPGGLQSMGWLRGHDWATSLSLFTFMHWRRKWQPTLVFLPGESQGQGSLVGCCLWGRRGFGHDWSNLAAAAVQFSSLIKNRHTFSHQKGH